MVDHMGLAALWCSVLYGMVLWSGPDRCYGKVWYGVCNNVCAGIWFFAAAAEVSVASFD